MALLITRKLSQKLYATALRTFTVPATGKPYWLSKFPDGRPRSFEEIPVIEERYDARKVHEASVQWFRKYGYVVRECMTDNTSCIHLYHFDDFRTVYYHDGPFPLRKSHRAIRQYRSERTHLYENVGLGAGEGDEWWELRSMMAGGITEKILRPLQPSLEAVVDDLVHMLDIKSFVEGDVDMLQWLFRWAFESIGVVTLNRRFNALSVEGDQEADNIVDAAGITNEMIALTEVDWDNYEKHYQRLVLAQDYMYSVITKYIDEIDLDDDSKCVGKTLLRNPDNSKKNAITLIMDIFQGALQTVPLTVLMALYHLARNQEVQATAREELVKLLPSRRSKYFSTVQKFDEMPPYLNGIVWETLRLSPPIIGNGRILQEDLILGGYLVPKGTNTILHHQVACLLEENFAEPLAFKPDRHPTPHMQHLEYVFGGRRRICFGRTFSLGQMALVLAKILRDFKVVYKGEDITMINRLHNEPEKPLLFRLYPTIYASQFR